MYGKKASLIGMRINRFFRVVAFFLVTLLLISFAPGYAYFQEIFRDFAAFQLVGLFIVILGWGLIKPFRSVISNYSCFIGIVVLFIYGIKILPVHGLHENKKHLHYIEENICFADLQNNCLALENINTIIAGKNSKLNQAETDKKYKFKTTTKDFALSVYSLNEPLEIDNSSGNGLGEITKLRILNTRNNTIFAVVIFSLPPKQDRESLWDKKIIMRRAGALVRHRLEPTIVAFSCSATVFSIYYNMFSHVSKLTDMRRLGSFISGVFYPQDQFFFGG